MSDPSDVDKPSMQPGSMRTISDTKLVNFALGQQKKTRFQKMRESKEQKEREDAEEAALVFQSFADSFKGEEGERTFVRSSSGGGTGGVVYKASKTTEMDRLLAEMKERDAAREVVSSNGKAPKQIDLLLNEMKSHGNDAINQLDANRNTRDAEDLITTNIFLGSLAPSVTERLLFAHFGQFGALNSIKIMWPRNEEERSRNRNTGFVSFRRRVDAETAMMELQDTDFHGHKMVMHWGKPVPVSHDPLQLTSLGGNSTLHASPVPHQYTSYSAAVGVPPDPSYYPPTHNDAYYGDSYNNNNNNNNSSSAFHSSYQSGMSSGYRPPVPSYPYASVDPPPPTKSLAAVSDRELSGMSVDNLLDSVRCTVDPSSVTIQIHLPRDVLIKGVIDSTAKAVAAGGQLQENVIRNQMHHVKHYEFLRAVESDDWWYYQWRTHAFRSGEGESDWSLRPCQLTPGGPTVYPPPFPGSEQHSYSTDRSGSSGAGGLGDGGGSRKRSLFSTDESDNASGTGGVDAKYASMTGAQIEREKNKKRTIQLAKLNNRDYREWRVMLSKLTLNRASIKEAMGFAFDKIESSEEIVSMIKDNLILPSDRAAKIAGLYLLSDILHNAGSNVKQAAHYRGVVQAALPEVMEDLAELMRRTKGRMSAFQVEDRVRKVLSVWADWSIFPTLFLIGLQAMFYFNESEYTTMQQQIQKRTDGESATENEAEMEVLRKKARATGIAFTEKTSSCELHYRLDFIERYSKHGLGSLGGAGVGTGAVSGAFSADDSAKNTVNKADTMGTDDVDGQTLPSAAVIVNVNEEQEEDIDGVPLSTANADIDGVPLQDTEDIDGVPLQDTEDIDGVPLQDTEDIDGVPLQDTEDIDGVPLEEDIDGVPM